MGSKYIKEGKKERRRKKQGQEQIKRAPSRVTCSGSLSPGGK
jgi:hypothetical protein